MNEPSRGWRHWQYESKMTEPTAAELNESATNHFSRGNGLEAARQLQWALIADPHYAEAWHNRAMVLKQLGDPFDAILCCDRAIKINPNVAAYHNTKGVCWGTMGQLAYAVISYDEALRLNPQLASAWHNKGSAAKVSGRFDDAIAFYGRAVELRPDSHDYHVSYSAALLAAGRLAEGWQEYEHRFMVGDAFHRLMPLPQWNGTDKCGGLILYAEQGFGDAIMFLRFASRIRWYYPLQVGMKVYVEVKKPLVELVQTMTGFDGVICYGDPLPRDATHCLPLMSAPRFCGINTLEDIPADVPYFHVVPPPIHWPSVGAPNDTLKVGLCWNSGHRPYQPELKQFAETKSCPLHFLTPLAETPGVTWVSLQVPPTDRPFEMVALERDLHDFYETAKLMAHLDLVVSVDTSVAHLAGAMGIETIVMTPHENCWRWHGDRRDSPWYPTLIQFRQKAPGDWPSVIEDVVGFVNMRSAEHAQQNIPMIFGERRA